MRSLARIALRRAGFDVVNLKHNQRFGWDWMRDVGRLAPLIGSKIEMVFDVGANNGYTALELRRHFPDAHIHSFEPVPATYERLARTVAADPRISTHPIALGPKHGPATMQCFDSSLLNSCAPSPPFNVRFPQASTCIDVTMRRIDDYCAEHAIDRISLLKIDAEGFDLQMLANTKSTRPSLSICVDQDACYHQASLLAEANLCRAQYFAKCRLEVALLLRSSARPCRTRLLPSLGLETKRVSKRTRPGIYKC